MQSSKIIQDLICNNNDLDLKKPKNPSDSDIDINEYCDNDDIVESNNDAIELLQDPGDIDMSNYFSIRRNRADSDELNYKFDKDHKQNGNLEDYQTQLKSHMMISFNEDCFKKCFKSTRDS